jgi:hypothetical protein
MPLITDDIFEARAAYASLEVRTLTAEQNVSLLQNTIGNLAAGQQSTAQSAATLRQFSAGQIQSNSQLLSQASQTISPDISLESFIASLGLSAAMGEASMPDRAIPSLNVTIQGYVTFDPTLGPLAQPMLRLYQPEFGSGSVLATISFELAKVTPQPNAPVPRSMYTVLQDKQAVLGNVYWTKFATGTPPSQPAAEIVIAVTKTLGSIDSWTFPFLITQAVAIAALETTLAGLAGAGAFTSAVASLSGLTLNLSERAAAAYYVAGDLFALSASLDATTQIARTLLP